VFIRLAICSAIGIPDLIRALLNADFQRVFHLCYPTEDARFLIKKWLAKL
jgi:hypothetical protein